MSDECCSALLAYAEEDQLVDFKESFDPTSEKAWIDFAIDCVAFANTEGGYVVFGVVNGSWRPVGIDAEAANSLGDTKRVLEQVNKCLAPHITALRTRVFSSGGLTFAVAFVPPSLNATHIYESNRDLIVGGKNVPRVPKGAIYVRRVASNQVATAADFEQLLGRRIDRFRDKILEGMARVVKADPDTEVITVKVAPSRGGARNVTVVHAPSELAISGRTVTIALNTIEDQIAVYMALSQKGTARSVPESLLYEAYALREEVTDLTQVRWLAEESLVGGAPPFYWLVQLERGDARKAIEAGFDRAPVWRKQAIRDVSGFFGKPLYEKLNAKISEKTNRRPFRGTQYLFDVKSSGAPEAERGLATEYAKQLSQNFVVLTQIQLSKVDCSLYAPF